MTTRSVRWVWVLGILAGCSAGDSNVIVDADSGVPSDVRLDRPVPVDLGEIPGGPCTDTDGDGLADGVEGAPSTDTDGDGMPDFRDTDSDNDGFSDAQEARRSYPGFESMQRNLVCGGSGDNCDGPMDSVSNWRDTDSDNDGLTDAEERAAGSNPCAADSDGDGATDLIERTAGSSPTDRMSQPPAGSLYVVLPYYAPPASMPREQRDFSFTTTIREADVFFLVDTSESMQPVIDNLRANFTRTIVPGVRRAIPDVRMGVGAFDSMPVCAATTDISICRSQDGQAGRPGDYALWVRQPITDNVDLVQTSFNSMRTIEQDTMGAATGQRFGADSPENATEAAYEVIEGSGARGFEGDAAALRSVRNALDPTGNGWVPRVDPARDCGSRPGDVRYGWGCFGEGRVPIVVLTSDAAWYDGCIGGSRTSTQGHNCNELVTALNNHGGFFLGVDVSAQGLGGPTYSNAEVVAMRTRTTDENNRPIVFGPGRGGIGGVSQGLTDAISRLANLSRQDITTRNVPDAMATGLPTGRSTADFIRSVVPLRGDPEMPTGYERRDMTTFYGVLPSTPNPAMPGTRRPTQVTFRVDFFNDFAEGGDRARLYQATIEVLGRARSVVDRRPVFIVVPARGSGIGAPG
ncbi:MAG: hypothetical protein JNK72_02430 [Myxococcales bacterium]|nr:hypothetical protein [Myxococcales bacterium]